MENIKTDATLDQLAEFLANRLRDSYNIGTFDRCDDFIQADMEEIKKDIIEFMLEFTLNHPVRP